MYEVIQAPARFRGAALAAAGARHVAAHAGSADDATREPNTQHTVFQASSVSKQVVAVSALLLAERGRLDLHASIAVLLPRCPDAWREVTMHDLLNHTAGFGHWKDLPGFDVGDPGSSEDLLRTVAELPLLSAPGERWRYSGPGYALAAALIAEAADSSYTEFVTEAVLRPAGMTETVSGSNPAGPGLALGHTGRDQTGFVPGLVNFAGTGDLWTTTGDLVAFIAALEGAELISRASLDLLRTPWTQLSESSADGWTHAEGYGYGVYTGVAGGRPAFFHPGDNPGYRSWLGWFPDEAATVAVLSNDDATPVERAAHLLADALLDST